MRKIIVTAEMKARLNGLNEKQERHDEQGNLIGYFEPASTPNQPPVRGGWGPFTDEEVEVARKDTGPAKTLDEIIEEAGLE